MTTAEATIDIGTLLDAKGDGKDLTLERLSEFRKAVQASKDSRERLIGWLEDPETQRSKTKAKQMMRAYGLHYLGRVHEAEKVAAEIAETEIGAYVQGCCLLERRDANGAVDALKRGMKKNTDSTMLKLALAEATIEAGDAKSAGKLISQLAKELRDSTDVHYLTGKLHESQGDHDEASKSFEAALEEDGDHARSLFALAYYEQMYGDDQRAILLYEELVELKPTYLSALLNLGILYEDHSQYELAEAIYHRILKDQPTNLRAKMFLKDSQASMDMLYDEEQERRQDRRSQILKIPVTDFELSVRSRNCLNKMNIRCLGDLIMKTETELLNYKNFGETSLMEIKQMLAQKGLRLGMGRKDDKRPPTPEGMDEEFLNKPITELEFSVRVRKCMEKLNIVSIGDLISKTEAELLAAKNFGQTSLNEIKSKLAEINLKLRTE